MYVCVPVVGVVRQNPNNRAYLQAKHTALRGLQGKNQVLLKPLNRSLSKITSVMDFH